MTDHPEPPGRPRPLPFDPPPGGAPPAAGGAAPADPGSRPLVADDRRHDLDPRSVTAARLAGLVWAAALGLLSLIPTLFILLTAGFGAAGWLSLLGAWLLFVAGVTALVLVWPGLRYRYASYRVNDRGIQIHSGVLFRSVVSVPRSRVQHTDISRGPIERNFGLATLVIHTAGTQHASVPLAGLAEPVAEAIRDYLLDGGADDAV